MRLSILIPSIPSRFDKAVKLYNSLLEKIEDREIEIIMMTDNKVMTIGEKQNHLKTMAHGKYFCFLHDDDELVNIYDLYEATSLDVDVITFDALCYNTDGSTYIVTQKLGNEIEHNTKDGNYLNCNRPPFPNCLWHNKFKQFNFPEISYSEDWEWIKQCLQAANTEHHIDQVLFKYNFSLETSEASTESNSHWQNPNI